MSNTPSTATRTELMRRDIPENDTLELAMFLLFLPPGAAAPAHTHPGMGVGYVLVKNGQPTVEPL